MLDIKVLNLSKLKGKEKASYRDLISDTYRGHLSGVEPKPITNSEIIAVAALLDGQPVGLALGIYRAALLPGELYSLFVQETHRHTGIGGQLLKKFEEVLKEKGSRNAKLIYQAGLATTLDFESLLQANQWRQGTMVLAKVYFDAAAFNPKWLHQKYPLAAGCEQFMWKDLKAEEKSRLEYLVEQGAIPSPLSPFQKKNQIDWKTSVGLRNKDGVIGWMVNLRPSRDVLEYRSLFVFADYYLQGHAMRLLSQSILFMQKKPPRLAVLETYLNNVDNRWIKFVKNRLIPYAEKIERFYEVWKTF